ncbi:MAG: ATPase, T2SS/T4P/T4SS family [Acidobacteria bacterium]|nr:ATPase, T2SS/T4P/T4SS family [Acidobacteriota bacterium]
MSVGPGGKITLVTGASGAAGATTVAVNLAAALPQYAGGRALLVDAHFPVPAFELSRIGLDRARAMGELAPVMAKLSPELLSGYLTSFSPTLAAMPIVSDVQQARQITPEAVKRVLDMARRLFVNIVVDAGPLSGTLMSTLLDQSDAICVVVEPSTGGLQRAHYVLDYLRTLQIGRDAVLVCLGRVPPRSAITLEIAQNVLQVRVSAAIPEDPSPVQEAETRKQPVFLALPRAAVSREMDRLVRDVASRGLRVAQAVLKPSEVAASSQAQFRDVKARLHKRLISEIDLRKGEMDYMKDPVKLAELRRRAEAKVEALVEEEAPEITDRSVRLRVIKEVMDEALGLGPLEDLLADPAVTEIMVNGAQKIYVERKGKLELTHVQFLSNDHLRLVIERIVAPIGRRVDEKVPLVDARLTDGSRVNAIIPPLALDGPALTIRKFAKSYLTVEDLVKFGSLTQQMATLLAAAVRARQNIVVSGGTGSGKTTLLNLLAGYIPSDERIVTIEDSAELRLAQDHVVRLESRPPNIEGEGAITIRDLVKNALRMRPDRVVIGECRGGETLDMLQAMNTGHDGSLTTVHANTPTDALSRIETMSLMSGLDLPARAIRDQIAAAVHLIVQQARLPDGSRRITHISEVLGLSEQGFEVSDIFVFTQTGLTPEGKVIGQFVPTGHVPRFVDKLSRRGIVLPREIFLHQTA